MALLSKSEIDTLTSQLKAYEDAKRSQRELNQIVEEATGPEKTYQAALKAIAEAQTTRTVVTKDGVIITEKALLTTVQAARATEMAAQKYQAAMNPLKSYYEGIEKEMQMIGLTAEEQDIYNTYYEQSMRLKEKGIVYGTAEWKGEMNQVMALKKLSVEMKAQPDLWRDIKHAIQDWGSTLSSTLNDMMWEAKFSFSSILESFSKMITEMVIRTQILMPIMRSLFPSSYPSGNPTPDTSSFGNDFLSMGPEIQLANGGIMTSKGTAQLRKYASGGVATGPQLALYGEGSMNEAYVPLPDGRSIPVSMKGGQAPSVVFNITNNSGQDIKQSNTQSSFNGKEFVISTVIEAASKNQYGLRDFLKSTR